MEPKFVHFIVEPNGDVSVGYGATEQAAKEAAEAARVSQQSNERRAYWLTFARTAAEAARDDEAKSHIDPMHGHWGGL